MEQGSERARVGSKIPTLPLSRPTNGGGIPVPTKFGFSIGGSTRPVIPRPSSYSSSYQDLNETRLVKPSTLNTTSIISNSSDEGGGTTPIDVLTPSEEESWRRSVGKRVAVGGVKTGILLFFGPVKFASGYFCGISLDEPEGRHDGSIGGYRYYNCPPKQGLFAPVGKVTLLEPTDPALPPIRNSYSTNAMDTYSFDLSGKTKLSVKNNKQSLPRRDSDLLSSTFVADLHSPDRSRMRQSTSLNSTFVNHSFNGSFKEDHNRTFDLNRSRASTSPGLDKNVHRRSFAETYDLNSTYHIEEELDTTFHIRDKVKTPSPRVERMVLPDKDDMYDVPEDDCDESSLGLLSPSQMMDFSVGTDIGISIPKTHSCDDINDLPEEEVVENITVEYSDVALKSHIVSQRYQGDKTPTKVFQHRLSSTPVSDVFKDKVFDSPVLRKEHLSMSPEESPSSEHLDESDEQRTYSCPNESVLDDMQLTLCNLTLNSTDSSLEDSIPKRVREHLLSSEKPQQLASVLKEASVGQELLRTLKQVDLEKLGVLSKEREAVLSAEATFNKIHEAPPQAAFGQMTKSVEWSTDVVDVMRKSRLVSSTGSIGNTDLDEANRLSIEKVMEVIQRDGELYKNRPASTYTVGSADTGYQGDGEFDQHSEIGTTAGSPSEEAKFMSVCSQDSGVMNTDHEGDKLVKSGHMSDSDFFTDQGGASEMENDVDMKRSTSSSIDGVKPLTGITEDVDDTLMADDEAKTVNEAVETITEESPREENVTLSKDTKDKVNSTIVVETSTSSHDTSSKGNASADSRRGEGPETIRRHTPKTPKKTIVVSQPAPVKVVGVSKIKALLEASAPTAEELAAKRAARTPKKSRWDSVTAKISDDKDKPKQKREIKSRINTNLAGARQAAKRLDKDNDNSETSGHQTPSSKSQTVTGATDSLLPRDPPSHCSSRGTDDVVDVNLDPNSFTSASSNKALSFASTDTGSVFERPESEVAPSEKSLASSRISQATNGTRFKSQISRLQPRLVTQSKSSARAINLENKKPISGKHPIPPILPPVNSIAISRQRIRDATNPPIKSSQPPINSRALPKKNLVTAPPPDGATSRFGPRRPIPTAAPSQSRVANKTTAAPEVSVASKQMAPREVNQTRTRGNATSVSSAGNASASMRLRTAQAAASKVEELSKEVQRLGALCEARTKELNMVKMQTKHTALGFDAFGVLVKYLVGELDAFSHPDLVADIQKTKEQLITLESVLKQYEADVELMKTTHSDKLNSLATELCRSEAEILSLNNKLNEADATRAKEIRETVEVHETKAKEIMQVHLHSVENLKISHLREIEGLEFELKEKLEETLKRHEAEKDDLKAQIEVQRKRYLSMEQTAKAFEETLNKDTDAKIQWISAKNQELQQEVDSLKSVLDMKQQEIHTLRMENMKMKKGLEELPLERHRVMKLQARNEELQALVRDKVKSEKKLSCEHRRLKEFLELEEKYKQQLTMENEELHWKIKNSFDGTSFLNATVEGNIISLVATPEATERFKNLKAMAFNPLSPFRETHECSPMQTSIACLEDAKKTFRNNKPKPRRPSKSCSASPRKSPSRHHLVSSFVASTPLAQFGHKPLDLSHLGDRSEFDETLDISGTSSRSLESPQESLTELHFKACLHIDAMEEMAQVTNMGLDPGTTRALLQSPDGMSSDSGGPGGCSSLASSSVAEDGMSASVSSVEPDDKDLLIGLTPETSFYGPSSPRNEGGEAMLGSDSSPFSPNGQGSRNSPEPVDSITTTSTYTNSKTSNATNYEPCFCDDFDINSEPE